MKKGTKNFLLVMAGFLGAAGLVGAGVATVGILRQNNIKTPWDNVINNAEYKDTYVGVRFFADGSDPVRTGVAKDFVAGINGDKNDFDHYPVYGAMTAKKRSDGNIAVSIPEHYVKTIQANSYVEYMMSPNQIDETWIKVEAHSIASYQANVTFDSKGKGTLHSQKDTYAGFNFTKVEAAEYAKRGGASLNTYVDAMDLTYLQTIEFATQDMQEIFSGYTSNENKIEDALTFDMGIQKEGKTNVIRIATEDFDEALGGKKASEVLIPGFTSIAIQDSDNYVSADVATVQSFKKVNIEIEAEGSSSSSEEKETINCYEITIDRTINFEDEAEVIAERWAERQTADGNAAEATDYDGSQFIQIGCYVKNGLTEGLKGSSHELTEFNGVRLPKGARPFSYRGVENWYGNVYEWLDGVQFKTVSSATAANVGCFVQTCEDKTLMGESNAADAKTPDYKTIAKLTDGSGNYAAGFGEMEEGKLFPIAVTDEEEGSFHDNVGYSGGNTLSAGSNSSTPADQVTLRPVYRGGDWDYGSYAGSFYLGGGGDFSGWDYSVGARLGF